MPVIKLIVDGGSMKPGPAVAQQIGPMGINLGKLIEDVNKETSSFKGVKVPVEIDINPKTKSYSIKVFSPPVAELLKKELSLEKGSGAAAKTKVGNLAIEQIIGIASTKLGSMLAKDLKGAVKMVVGSCVSLGILVENKNAKEVVAEIDSGIYDSQIKNQKTEVTKEKKAELEKYFKEVVSRQESLAKAEAEAKAAEEAAKLAAASAPGATPTTASAPATGTPAPAKKEEAKPAKDAKKK